MAYPTLVTAHDRNQAYRCRLRVGNFTYTASSTSDPQTAVERLMDKIWPPGTHRATPTGRDLGRGHTEFAINPIE